MKTFFITLFIFTFTFIHVYSQEENRIIKEVYAVRTDRAPKIDGDLNDEVWELAKPAKDFVMYMPKTGTPEKPGEETTVKILYNDKSLFIGATLNSKPPTKILSQLSERDKYGESDMFSIAISPNNDGQNEFRFMVSAAGVQVDEQVSPTNGADDSWNEIWYSKVILKDDVWYIEMEIPFAALRFSKEDELVWGLNFYRLIESKKEFYTWNPIDRTQGTETQHSGVLRGISGIKPPVHLSFSPFTTGIIDYYDGKTDFKLKAGLDMKYGITENFTLVATFLPDFSQTAFDNVVLNLGPFEQVYIEQREFFLEGADLFNKGDLFFSRRVAAKPALHDSVKGYVDGKEELELLENPETADVIAGIKFSGRTKKGLGIAMLNVATEETVAKIRHLKKDTITKITTANLTNYNVFAIDQEFHKNSSIGITNTNIIREEKGRDANVTALLLNLANKSNSYKITGNGSMSMVKYIPDSGFTKGYASDLRLLKTKGKFRFSLAHNYSSPDFDKNDMGYMPTNNYNKVIGSVSYQIFEPTKKFNSFDVSAYYSYERRVDPNVYTGSMVNLVSNLVTLNQISYTFDFTSNTGITKDFFEPRTQGRYWVKDPERSFIFNYNSDVRKKFSYLVQSEFNWFKGHYEYGYKFTLVPSYRANNKLNFAYLLSYSLADHELGFATRTKKAIIFGKRENQVIANQFITNYNFTDRSSLSFTFRHYWSAVTYNDDYYELMHDGSLVDSNYKGNNNLNFNVWNLDLKYVWELSRGSQLIALYRNNIFDRNNITGKHFFENMSEMFGEPMRHFASVKFIYFIDYNVAKNWFHKKSTK